jgi:hypothetical protein
MNMQPHQCLTCTESSGNAEHCVSAWDQLLLKTGIVRFRPSAQHGTIQVAPIIMVAVSTPLALGAMSGTFAQLFDLTAIAEVQNSPDA